LNGGAISYYASCIFPTNRALRSEEGVIPQRTLGLIIGRRISGGMHEDLDMTNTARTLEVCLRHDRIEAALATLSSRPMPYIEDRTLPRVRHSEIWS
jgi:hypothetical protein